MAKKKGEHLFIVSRAALKLGDHSFKYPFIFQRGSCVKDALIVGYAIASQNILYIISRKMNPVHFGLVNAVVFIFLKFFWPVDNHVSGGYDGFVLFMIKMKMCNSGSNIENLKINSSPRTVGGKLWAREKMISAAASHNKRSALIFKIQVRIIQITRVQIHNPSLANAVHLYCTLIVSFCAYSVQSYLWTFFGRNYRIMP